MAKSKVCWAEYRYTCVTGDLTANVALSWRTNGSWSKAATPTAEVYPRHVVKVLEAYAILTDSSVVLRDGSVVSICELAPRPTALIEWANVVQSPTDRALVTFPTGMPVDIGLCFFVATGGVIAAGDCLYAFVKYEVEE